MRPQITIAQTRPALAELAARMIVETAREAASRRGRFLVALAGGDTPRETYALLACPPLRGEFPWDRTWVFFGDERGVPPDHRESNYRMAHEAFLAAVPLPPGRVLRMRAEAEDLDAAAAEYARSMLAVFGTPAGEPPPFDLVLLGLGIDGHTASLFPNSPALRETQRWVVPVHATAAAIPQRLTMTLPVFNAGRRVAFLSAGAEKAKVVRSVLVDAAPLPAGMIRPHGGHLQWLLDRTAAALLDGALGS